MFDYVECAYPLPEGAPRNDYQTKDTPDQLLTEYLITEDGYLVNEDDAVVIFDGAIEFYYSNISGSGPQGYITKDDNPAEFWSFTATFEQGKVIAMEGGKETPTEMYRKPPLSREEFWGHNEKGMFT